MQSLFCFLIIHGLLILAPKVQGQSFSDNGQFFTKGLAISDAPAPNSPQHAGSDIVIAVDLSGDGKIPQDAFTSNSNSPTHYLSLSIFLVSANSNFTVSNASTFLSQEPGSTVKHLNWPIPNCVPSGSYNLTYYETAIINNQEFFSVTPLPITMQNANPSSDNSQCTAISNAVQAQPQTDSSPTTNPYIDPSSPLFSSNVQSPGGPIAPTITISSAGLPSGWSIGSNGAPTATVTTTAVTTATLVVVSAKTLTETVSGQTNLITTTEVETNTLTVVMPTSAVGAGGFLPVNGAKHLQPSSIPIFGTVFGFVIILSSWSFLL